MTFTSEQIFSPTLPFFLRKQLVGWRVETRLALQTRIMWPHIHKNQKAFQMAPAYWHVIGTWYKESVDSLGSLICSKKLLICNSNTFCPQFDLIVIWHLTLFSHFNEVKRLILYFCPRSRGSVPIDEPGSASVSLCVQYWREQKGNSHSFSLSSIQPTQSSTVYSFLQTTWNKQTHLRHDFTTFSTA